MTPDEAAITRRGVRTVDNNNAKDDSHPYLDVSAHRILLPVRAILGWQRLFLCTLRLNPEHFED